MLVYKFTSPACRSVPDRIFITKNGIVFFVEFKRWGGKTTAAQEVEIAKIQKQGIQVFVINNIEGGKEMIKFMDEEKRDLLAGY